MLVHCSIVFYARENRFYRDPAPGRKQIDRVTSRNIWGAVETGPPFTSGGGIWSRSASPKGGRQSSAGQCRKAFFSAELQTPALTALALRTPVLDADGGRAANPHTVHGIQHNLGCGSIRLSSRNYDWGQTDDLAQPPPAIVSQPGTTRSLVEVPMKVWGRSLRTGAMRLVSVP